MSVFETPTARVAQCRGSYPSKQPRFGPAPLASFEDLPTDEQSSSSEDDRKSSIVNISSNITFVITDHDQSSKNFESNSVNNKVNKFLDLPQHKENKRKSSWADFFSLRKSPSPIKTRERKFSLFNFKFFSKDDNRKSTMLESEMQLTKPPSVSSPQPISSLNTLELENCSQLQLYRVKSPEVTNEVCTSPNSTETIVQVARSNSANSQADEDNKTLTDSHSLNSTSLCSLDHAIDNRIIDDTNDEVCCKSASECTECLDCDRIVITCDCVDDTDCFNPADNEDNDDPDNDSNQSSYDSFELQSLLKCDELDPKNRVPEETSPKLTLDLKRLNANKLNLKSSTEKLKTSPIDRPRSITPININSFEAYLNQPQAIDSNSSKCDKLTITLPGPQSNGRNRFSRKSNPFIWQEFCEKGLKSPHIPRKRANSCFPQLNQQNSLTSADDVGCSPENLTPITPIQNLDGSGDYRFDDNFWEYNTMLLNESKSKDLGDVTKNNRSKYSINNLKHKDIFCSCDCNSSHTSANGNCLISLNTCSEVSSYSEITSDDNCTTNCSLVSGTKPYRSEFNEDQPLMSPCDCVCHQGRSVSLNQTDITELLNQHCTNENNNIEEEILWQLSSSTLSSTSTESTSQSNRLLESSATSN